MPRSVWTDGNMPTEEDSTWIWVLRTLQGLGLEIRDVDRKTGTVTVGLPPTKP